MYRCYKGKIQVLLVHPGGPYWAGKEHAGWSLPKGLIEPGEEPLAAAEREFQEETGFTPHGPYIPLQPVKMRSGKIVQIWAFEGDCDPTQMKSNLFTMEWPPDSGKIESFPEVDRAEWFDIEDAKSKVHKGQAPLITELQEMLGKQ